MGLAGRQHDSPNSAQASSFWPSCSPQAPSPTRSSRRKNSPTSIRAKNSKLSSPCNSATGEDCPPATSSSPTRRWLKTSRAFTPKPSAAPTSTLRGRQIMLSIAYGEDQRDGMKLHYPEVCYPAQGFQSRSFQIRADQLSTTARPRQASINGTRAPLGTPSPTGP